MRILHLEDSITDAELIVDVLRSRWGDLSISTVRTQPEFESAVLDTRFDLILSDYSLPGYNGLDALAFARTHQPETPFIYVSGTIGEERAIKALQSGARDYIIKDRPARLIPAIEDALKQGEDEKASRSAQAQIAEQAALLAKAREAICSIDARCLIKYWNASAERHYGHKAEAVIGQNLRTVLHPGDTSAFDTAYALVLATGEWRGELHPTNTEGEALSVDSSWSLVTNDDGVATSILIVEADISEKKRIEAQLMQTKRLETLGLLASGIAHDLNNVLTPIIAAVDLLGMIATDPRDRELVDTLEMSAQHGSDLVNQLMAFARGKDEQRQEITPEILISDVCRLMRRSLPESIAISSVAAKNLPDVNADPTQLRQVLLNLCINARDAMPEGGSIEIRADPSSVPAGTRCVHGEARAGRYVRITVADTGTGIPPEIVDKLFDPFFTTKKAGKGTGLGLANVFGIVQAHGGFVDLKSVVGKGTKFHIYLPLSLPDAHEQRVASAVPSRGVPAAENILVVDDDEMIRRVLNLILGNAGYGVTLAQDGGAALKLIQEDSARFSLVLTDLNMPGMSGIEFIREIRKLANPIPIVVLSGLPDKLPDMGVEYLAKPLSAEKILKTVRRILDRAQLSAGPAPT